MKHVVDAGTFEYRHFNKEDKTLRVWGGEPSETVYKNVDNVWFGNNRFLVRLDNGKTFLREGGQDSDVTELFSEYNDFTIGASHILAVRNDNGKVEGFGADDAGQLQFGNIYNPKQMQAAGNISLFLSEDGEVSLFGGQTKHSTDFTVPDEVKTGVSSISLNYDHVACLKDGKVYCWGLDEHGQCDVTGYPEGEVEEVFTSLYFTAIRLKDGSYLTFGKTYNGQENVPTDILGEDRSKYDISFGSGLCIAVTDEGKILTWGRKANG